MPLLREILHLDLSPFHNNLAASQLMVIFFKIVVEVVARLRFRFVTRQMVHMSLSSLIVFWPLFDTDHWSWRLNCIVPSAMLARFVYKGGIQKDPEDFEVQTMSRSSSPSELLFGPLQLAAIMLWLGLYQFMTEEAAVIAAAVGIGDGIAPMIGSMYGRHVYQMPLAGNKTMEGTVVGVFLGTVSGCYLYLYLLGMELVPLRLVLVYGGIAAAMEGTAVKGLDNIVVAVALHLSMPKVQEWLPA